MKKLLLMIIIVFQSNNTMAQTLTSGTYFSSDLGPTYTVNTEQKGNIIIVTEPNRINRYIKSDGNVYFHSEAKYDHFYLRVIADNKYFAGKKGGGEQLFTLVGLPAITGETLPSGIDDCPLYEKYLNLSKNDETEIQAWAFCGAAALAKCSYSDARSYLEPLIKALKSIMVDPLVCPCTDAISQYEWESVKID